MEIPPETFPRKRTEEATQHVGKAWPWQSTHHASWPSTPECQWLLPGQTSLLDCPRDPLMQCAPQTVSGETVPILKKAFVKLTLRQRPLTTCVFLTNITEVFILGLDVLCARDASLDLRHHTLWGPRVQPHSSPYRKRSSKVAATRCDRVTAMWLEGCWIASQGQVPGPPIKLKWERPSIP
jgi:hypothetical protein